MTDDLTRTFRFSGEVTITVDADSPAEDEEQVMNTARQVFTDQYLIGEDDLPFGPAYKKAHAFDIEEVL